MKKNKKNTSGSDLKNKFYHKKVIKDVHNELKADSTFSIAEVIIVVFIAILFGVIIGYITAYNKSPLFQIRSDGDLVEIVDTYTDIKDTYYDGIDQNKLADAAIRGMVEVLDDPYSIYMDKEATTSFNETLDGQFVGIGITVSYDSSKNKNTIVSVAKGSPAEKAGLCAGDVIETINGGDASTMSSEELSNIIKGKSGTKLKITISRKGTLKSYAVKRDVIEISSVTSNNFIYEDMNVGYINIKTFASNTYKQFNRELQRLEKKGIDSLIIDVRGNPGGQLPQARQILSLFFDKKTVLYQIENKNSREKVYSLNNATRSYPIAVLIDKQSASASEVLASSLQENYKKSIVVGKTSYGKGTVQKSSNLKSGNSIKYTIQKWLTTDGKWLGDVGVTPDVEVTQSSEYAKNSNYNTDKQLQETLKLLKKEFN